MATSDTTRSDTTRNRDAETPALPDRVTMPLLDLVTREAVDEDYILAARRRAASGWPAGSQRTGQRGVAVVVVLFGLLIALAAIQTARNSDAHQASLNALTDRIDERKSDVSELEDRTDRLQRENADLESTGSRLGSQLAAATVDLRALQLSTGFVPVSGPGLRFTVSDSPDGSPDGRVRATDLRRLVNGLWNAGAEAIAVNGRRLSAISAIVQANISIQVNRGPLSPPYVVTAIGDSGLGTRFDNTATGLQFQALADQFGFQVDRQNESELELPAAPDAQLRLRYAEPPDGRRNNEEDVP